MQWIGERLWIFDSKGAQVRVYEWKNGTLAPVLSQTLGESVIALTREAGASRELLILAGPKAERQGGALIRYRYGRRLLSLFR